MRFGVHIPTCIEGMMYPVPFARPADILRYPLVQECEGGLLSLTAPAADHPVQLGVSQDVE